MLWCLIWIKSLIIWWMKFICVSQDVQQHLWPLPARCQQHSMSPTTWQPQMPICMCVCVITMYTYIAICPWGAKVSPVEKPFKETGHLKLAFIKECVKNSHVKEIVLRILSTCVTLFSILRAHRWYLSQTSVQHQGMVNEGYMEILYYFWNFF